MKIPTLLGLSLLLIAISLAIALFYYNQTLNNKIYLTFQPKDIKIINISDSQATITWQTQTSITGQISWGENNTLGNIASDSRDSKSLNNYLTHFVTLKNLLPNKEYYFKIRSGVYFYPETVSRFKTASLFNQDSQSSTIPPPIIGKILDSQFQPIDEALIYLKIDGASEIGTFTTVSGNFILPLSNIPNANLTQLFSIQPNTSATLNVTKANLNSDAKVILPPITQVLPPIVIGQNIDFSNIKPSTPSSELVKYDLNGDGKVNSIDLSILLDNLGSKFKLKAADLDGDGVVDQKDIDLMKQAIKKYSSSNQ